MFYFLDQNIYKFIIETWTKVNLPSTTRDII